ncbi:HAD family hydrolase [Nocardioides sp. BGMRC 2183]|nr:HAD family hydrolase [Nocardioides sp. BGMRC 2183]
MGTAGSAVLFDIDGTLVDSTYHHAVAWHRAFARHGRPPPMWRLHRAIGMGGDKLVTQVAGEETERRLGDDLRAEWRTAYLELRTEVHPLPGAAELVGAVRRAGHRVALASSGDPQFAREAIAMLEIGEEVELLTTAEDVDASKPEPDLIGETMRRLGGVTRAVLVGDTVYDVESAARAGIPCVGLLCGGYGRAELDAAGAVAVAETPEDLVEADWASYLPS